MYENLFKMQTDKYTMELMLHLLNVVSSYFYALLSSYLLPYGSMGNKIGNTLFVSLSNLHCLF